MSGHAGWTAPHPVSVIGRLRPGGTRAARGVRRGLRAASKAPASSRGLAAAQSAITERSPEAHDLVSQFSRANRVMTAVPVNGSGARAGIEPALTANRPPEGRLREGGTNSPHTCTIGCERHPRPSRDPFRQGRGPSGRRRQSWVPELRAEWEAQKGKTCAWPS